MFHITHLTPTRFAIRPDAHLRSLGWPDEDLTAQNEDQALKLYLKTFKPKNFNISKPKTQSK